MVAIVSGNSLGLSLGSLATLGQRGLVGTAGQGRSGEQSFVNIANGNLVLQDRDDVLLGRGLDINAVRTYNSQGLFTDDNGDNWSVGAFGQKIVLTSGAVGTAGSTLTRTDRDGAQAAYTWDAAQNRYTSPSGSGAFDTIAYDGNASQFVWTDGDTGRIERYQSSGAGRLVSVTDTDGNTVSYAYNANGTVQSVTDANGDVSYYDYSGTNLTQIRTVSGGVTTTTVRYAYDTGNRLFKVTVDLSPGDNTAAGSDVYVTTYTYEGTSKRVASVTQSDGTQLSFTYVQSGGAYKVATVTDALGAVTRFSYDTAQNTTTVTDPLGAQSVYLYDAQGQLTQVRNGVTAANVSGLSQISYAYDAAGNVTLVTDGEGHKVTLQYDDHGNLTREVDSAGDTRVRTYNSANQLLTDTIYADAAVVDRAAFNKDAALPETTRYVYAAGNANRLRFAITPQGNVTEYRYDAYGQRTSAIKYAGAAYDTTALSLGDVPTEAQLSSWVAAQDRTRTELTELVYDARGQLSSSTTYAATAANGSGVAGTAATTQYIYDPRGLLLQRIEPATTAGGATAVTTYTYDGLGRLLSVSAPSLDGGATPNTTITSYDDANGKTSVTIANGLVTVSAYDKAGRLISVTQQSAGTGVLGTTSYVYDKDGNLLMTQDPTGVRKWMLYDEADRKIADIDATGAVIEYVYNANGQLRETIAYATPVGTAALVDGAGKPTTAWTASNTTTSLDALRPVNMPQDQKVWRFYDTANRLAWQVDALGYVTQTTYDGASRILSVTQLANSIDVTQLGNGANIELLVNPATVGGISLTIDAGTVTFGTAVTLTANIDGNNPGGMVTFFSGETVLGSAIVADGVATLVTSALPVGVDDIRAAYSGDTQRSASVSAAAQKTVTAAVTNAVLSFSPDSPATYGDVVTVSVALTTAQPPGLPAATGEVKFYSGSTLMGTASIINGMAVLATSAPSVGMLDIRAEYAGDSTHAAISHQQNYVVNPVPTVTKLTQVAGGSGALVLSASVGSALGSGAPSGTVTFYNGGTAIGTATLVNGVATLQYAGATTGAAFQAIYEGDVTNAPSGTSGTPGTISPSLTSVTLSASSINVTQDQAVTLTARVAGAAPGGLVTFFAGMQFLGTASVVDGRANFVTTYLPVGSEIKLGAAYSGDASNAGSVISQGPILSVAAGSSAVSAPAVALNAVAFGPRGSTTEGVPPTVVVYPAQDFDDLYYPGAYSVFDGQTLVASFVSLRMYGVNLPAMSAGTHNLTVVYAGDPGRTTAMATPQLVVDPPVHPSSVVQVSSSVSRITAGIPLTLTATIGYQSAGTFSDLAIGGLVTFYSNGAAIGTATVTHGLAKLTVNNFPLGTSNISAVYSGDASHGSAASANLLQQVIASTQVAPTATALTSSSIQSAYGASLTLNASVHGWDGSVASMAGGAMDFYDGTTFVATAQVVNGQANAVLNSLAPGVHNYTARYSGDSNNATSVSGSFAETIAASPSSVTLSASAVSATQDAPITLTAQVTGAVPGGVVTFVSGMTVLGTGAVVNGQASLVINNLPVGVNVVTAGYGGDANNLGSFASQGVSLSITEAVGPITLLNTRGSDDVYVRLGYNSGGPWVPVEYANIPNYSESVQIPLGGVFSASVSFIWSPPSTHPLTGTYSFFRDGELLQSSTSLDFATNQLPLGTYTIRVVYSGDSYNKSAASSQVVVTVVPAATSTQLSVSRTNITAGAPLTLTATVAGTAASAFGATGTVTFYRNGTAIGTARVVDGVAKFTISSLPLGTADMTASYSGDGNNTASASPVVVEAVNASLQVAPTSLTLASAGDQATAYGTAVTLSTSVMWGTAVAPDAGGTVSFYEGTTLVATANVVNGQSSATLNGLSPGTHNFTARYSGDNNNATSVSGSISQTVTLTATASASTVVLSASPTSATQDAPITLTAQVTGTAPGGVVTFVSGMTVLGTAALVNGQASLIINNLPLGLNVITAGYAGDANNLGSLASQDVNLTVAEAAGPVAPLDTMGTEDVYLRLGVDTGRPWRPVDYEILPSYSESAQFPLGAELSVMISSSWSSANAHPRTGTYSFFSDGVLLQAGPSGALVNNKIQLGTHTLQVVYSGDLYNKSAVSSKVVLTTVPAETTTQLSASRTSITAGAPLTLTATIANSFNVTGTVTFYSSGTAIGTAGVVDGVATFITSSLPLGTADISASYSGDGNNNPSTTSEPWWSPGNVVVTVQSDPFDSYGSLSISASPVLLGSSATLNTTFAGSGGPDGGTVTFFDGTDVIGSATLVNGRASLTFDGGAEGTHALSAVYSGDAGNSSATTYLNVDVVTSITPPPPSPPPIYGSLGVSKGQITYSTPEVLTATFAGPAGPEGGNVTFYNGTDVLGTTPLANGSASLTVSNLPVGTNQLSAVYSGDVNNTTATVYGYVTVALFPTTLTNLTPPSISKDGSLSVRINGVEPDGLVSFYEGLRLLGTAEVVNWVATLSGVPLPPGTRTFTAAYAGDAYNTEGEVSFTQMVQGTPVTAIYASLDVQQDRTVTRLYNRNGQLQGLLDAEGYLTEYKYNAAGEQIETIAYANRATDFTSAADRTAAIAIARGSYNLTGVRPQERGDADIHTYNLYDAQGRLVGQVDGEGYLTETIYDTRGNVTQIIRRANPAGAVNASSTVDSIRPAPDAAQDQVITQTWSAANQLLSRTNVEGTVTRFAYNSVGQLVQTTTAAGTADERISRARYDIQGRLIGELDGRGSDAVALADPLSLWAANGLTHTYDAAGRRASTTDANGHRTLFFYDAIGRLRYTVNAMGEVTESRYSAMGQLTEQVIYGAPIDVATLGATSPGGLDTGAVADRIALVANAAKDTHVLHTYNATGTQASTTDALNSTTSYSYNAFREAIASSYALKSGYVVTDTATYDRRGLKTQTAQDTGTLGITERKIYDAFGRATDVFDGNGNRSQFSFDRLGRVVTTTDALNGQRLTQYDAFDRVMYQRDAVGYWTSFGYDLANRRTTVSTSEGVSVTTVRNRQGQTQSVTDGRGNVTNYTYDKSGNLLQTSAALDGSTTVSTSATYDKTGLKFDSTDANGVVTSYTYDAANRLLTRTLDPAGLNLVTIYGYDAKGQTVSVTDPKGTATATEFDLTGQTVRQVVDPTGLRLTTSYTHDTSGQVLTVTDPNGNVTQYTYDGAGRRVKEQVDPAGLNLTRDYEYDAADNVTRSIDANRDATRYAYDANNRLVFTLDALGNLSRQEYDGEGRVTRRTSYAVPIDTTGLGNAPTVAQIQAKVVVSAGSDVTESRRYDGDGRLHFLVDGTGSVVEYKYDKANNVIEARAYANRINLAGWNIAGDPPVSADATRDERVRTVYDALNRALWKVDGAGNVRHNIYDANGNVTETLAYANALTGASLGAWDGQSAPTVVPDATRDQRIRTVYDTANRATWSVDALGDVVHYTYDADGNVIAKRSYATPLTATALAAWDGRTAPVPAADDAHDQRVRNVYDAANRLVWSVDGIGAVSKTEYDANGNVTRRSQYATPVAEGADPAGVPDSDADRVVDYLYDAGNRLRYQLRWTDTSEMASGMGWMREVTSYDYDGVGRLVRQTAHAWPLFSYVGNDIDSVFGNLSVAPGIDQAKYMVYDAAGRLSWSVDGTGAVTRNDYDGTGRAVRTIQYAQTVDVLGFGGAANGYAIPQLTDSALQSLLRPDAAVDRITAFAHDGAGRRTFTVDALGSVGRTVYDAFGNVTQQIGYDIRTAPPTTASIYTDAGLQASTGTNASADRIQRFAYDQANRQVFAVDAQGGTTESVYDGLGQEVQTRRYARAINVAGLSTTASAADVRARATADTVNDRVSHQVFNGAGQKIYGVDPMGFVSKTDYDGLGMVRGTTQYALSIPTDTANTATAIADAVVISPDDRPKSFQYDAVGRVLSTVDAMGFPESWTYDALGNKTSYTNAKQAVWTYAYDVYGRLVQETSPQVELTAVTPDGNGRLQVDAGSSGTGNVITVLRYDSFGNLRSRTEGAWRPEERTTTYEYDRVGRQVKVIYPAVGVYNGESAATLAANGANGSAIRVESVQNLFTETTYDALGNAVANRDIGGNYSYKTYDNLGRMAHEIDALGYVTGYERNTFGDVKTLTRFAAGTTLAAGAAANPTQAPTRDQVVATMGALLSGADRALRTDYDRLGRAIQVAETQTAGYDATLATQNFNASKTTRNTYDSFGQLVQVAKLKNAAAGTWALTTTFYDRRGQQTDSVDAEGHVTTQAFDAGGNVASRTEYANKLDNWAGLEAMAGWTGATNAGASGTAPRPAANARDDRTTTTMYDRNNRKTSETRVNVEYSAASEASATRGNLTTVYEYDAVGNLTVTTDALGGRTVSYYDALGRVTAVAEPTHAGADGSTPITPLTVFRRDAHGNVVLKTEFINGADANGNALSPHAMPDHVAIANPELVKLRGEGYVDINDIGYMSSAAFPGSKPLYRLQGTFYSWVNAYTTDESERAFDNASGAWKDGGIVGYVADPESPQPAGTIPLYRLHQFNPPWAYTQLVSDPGTIAALEATGWGEKKLMGYVSAAPTATLDTPLHHMQLAITDPLLGLVGAQNHLYVPGTLNVAPDPVRDADLYANTDRASFSQYDALGHKVQTTDAMGVNHYSSYNSQGLVAKDWQGVSGNDGATHTLFRAYAYDALGQQTHVYDPGTATDNADATQGGASGIYTTNPKATVTPAPPPGSVLGGGFPGQPVDNGKLALQLANVVNAQGGAVRVQFDYVTHATTSPGDENTPETITPGRAGTFSQDFPSAATAAQGVTLSPEEPMAGVSAIRILQEQSPGNWVLLWQGAPAQADGQTNTTAGANASAPPVDTAMAYNAFGELVTKSVNGQAGEYFDYNNAGQLWRTNAGDGVDKVALYDLLGNQSADIRSAGKARGDLNLRAYGTAAEVRDLVDVRRTNTSYDLLGRVTQQALAERWTDSQGGVTAQTGKLGIAILGGSGNNSVALSWPGVLEGLGGGDVQVTLHYTQRDANGAETGVTSRTVTVSALQAASGYTMAWADASDAVPNGVVRVTHVTVQKRDLLGDWQTVINQDGTGNAGRSVRIDAPGTPAGPPPGAQINLQWRVAGSAGDSGWVNAPLANFGESLRFDASAFGEGSYEYRVFTALMNQPATVTASGVLSVTPPVLSSFSANGSVNAAAQTFDWQSPGAGDTQIIRLRQVGTAAWYEQAIGQNGGTSSISLADLPGNVTYEYELLWSHAGEAGPYAHATGQIYKKAAVAGTPDIPGTDERTVSLPHIDGVVVESRTESVENDENGNPVTTRTVWVVRLPPPPLGLVGRVGMRINGDNLPLLLMQQRQWPPSRPDGYDEFVVTDSSILLRGQVYEFVYSYSPFLNADATQYTSGKLTYFADGSVQFEDTTPPVQVIPATPGVPGTPGTPAQYTYTGTTPDSPYAISQDRWLGGPQLHIGQALNGSGAGYVRPVVTQNTDRWGNVVSITDPRSSAWKTTYRYNANNQLVQQVQTDSDGNAGADASGNVTNTNAPVTQVYFDALGRQVAVRDARDNVNAQVWDAGGNLVQERHADGGTIDHRFNAFGNEVATVDARRNTTTSTYDKLDRLVRTVRPAAGVYTSGFVLGGVVVTNLGERNLQETQRWDQAGRKLSQTNANNETVKYAYDLRGNLVGTTQLRAEGSATPERLATIAAYDARNQKILEVDANGSNTTWRYDYFGQLQARTDLGKTGYGYSYDNARQLFQISGGQGQTMQYDAAGQLVRIDDTRIGTTSTYVYDLAGRHVRETTVNNASVYQDNFIAYDALGRMRWVADARAYVNIEYDKAGNRTRVTTVARDVGVQAASDTAYTYDAMNRQLTAGSHTFTYDANGNRASDTDSSSGGINESYDYDALNRLTRTSRSDGTYEVRAYDAASRVVQTAEEAGVKSDDYDDNGRLIASTQLKGTASALSGSNTTIYFYDAAGNAVNSLYVDPGSNTSSHTHTTYVAGPQGYQQLASTTINARGAIQIEAGTGNTTGLVLNGAASTIGSVTNHYDANGNKTLIVNDFEGNPAARNRNFVYDAGGRMLWTDDGTGNHIQRQLIVNGEALGQYGETVGGRMPFGFPNFTLLGYNAQATFDFASQRMSGLGTNPGVWVVREGDTLQSIAKSTYGDPSLWYRIAEANGLADNADLVNGQALTLPVVLSNASNVNTFTPYDPSRLVGDITPTMLDLPQPAQDKGCGGLGQVIVAIVAVVVAVYTGVYIGGVESIAGAAAAGAAGSVAGQVVGIAIGVQDSFSWKAVALAAIGGGISGAVGGINLFDAGTTAGVIGNAIVRNAIGNAASQGIAVATGLQDKFNWKSVAASAVSAGIGQGLNAAMDYNPSLNGFEIGKSLASGLGGSLAAQAVRGGKISAATLASDAFGNVIGDSIAAANSSAGSSRYKSNPYAPDQKAATLDAFLELNGNFIGDDITIASAPAASSAARTQGYGRYFGSGIQNIGYDTDEASSSMADRASGSALRTTSMNSAYALSGFLGNTSIDAGVGVPYAPMLEEIRVASSADIWTADKPLMFQRGDGYPLGVRNRVGLFADGSLSTKGEFTSGTPMGLSDAQIGRAQERLDFINASYYNSPNYHNNALTYGIASAANWLVGTGDASPVIPGNINSEYDQLRTVLSVNATGAQVQAVLAPNALRLSSDDWTGALNSSGGTTFLQRAQQATALANQAFSPSGWRALNGNYSTQTVAERRMAWSTVGAIGSLTAQAYPNTLAMGAAAMPQAILARTGFGEEVIGGAASVGRTSAQWGKTPQATERLYTRNRPTPMTMEDALNQADKFDAFNGNMVDYKVTPSGSVVVDHGGGLKVHYRGMADAEFDAIYGTDKMAAYKAPNFAANTPVTWKGAFGDNFVNVHIRESMLMSDRGSVAMMAHEYGELQMVYNEAGHGALTPNKWASFIDASHERVVPRVDRIIGNMIIGGGK